MTNKPMIAFYGNPTLKALYRAQLQAHYDADEIIKRRYWEDGKECAVGCLIHGYDYSQFPVLFGIPESIVLLTEGIFEGLPNDQAKEFPLQFWDAVPVGADLSGVIPKFLYWLLVDPMDGVLKYAKTHEQRSAIQAIGDLYARIIKGMAVKSDEWRAARFTAYAGADAAYSAPVANAAYTATSCAYAAYTADAAYAAYAAGYAADAAAYAVRIAQRDKLIELIKETTP